MAWYTAAILGCVGGVLPDVIRIVAARHDGPPSYLSSAFFWVSLVLLAVLGGLAAALVRPGDVVSALAVGFTAPEIISRLLGTGPERGFDQALPRQLRSWWGS